MNPLLFREMPVETSSAPRRQMDHTQPPISPSIDDVSGRRRGRLIARIAASQMDAVVGGREIKGGKKVSVLPAGLC